LKVFCTDFELLKIARLEASNAYSWRLFSRLNS
jgi:hypothetical protein